MRFNTPEVEVKAKAGSNVSVELIEKRLAVLASLSHEDSRAEVRFLRKALKKIKR